MTWGALTLFIEDVVEGLFTWAVQEYQVLWAKEVIHNEANVDWLRGLTYTKFQALIGSSDMKAISDKDVQQLWIKIDQLKDGLINFEEFVGPCHGIEQLVQLLQKQQKSINLSWLQWLFSYD